MAQQGGVFNTAPQPIPGGFGNPTGANTGLPTTSPVVAPPAYGMPVGALPTGGSGGGFPANGVYGTANGNAADPSMTGLNSAFTDQPGEKKQLDNDYGMGIGNLLYQMLGQGLYNPQVANALIAAMQPNINRGLSATEGAFAGEGARFSSSAQIGVGDYESQATLGENQVLANLFQQDQMAQLSLLEGILPTVNKEQDNSEHSGVLSDILGGVETLGGAAAMMWPGGQLIGAGLIGGGLSTIAAGNNGGGGGGSSVNLAQLAALQNQANNSGGTGTTGLNIPSNIAPVGDDSGLLDSLYQQSMQSSAGADLGGSSSGTSLQELLGLGG